MFSQPPSHHAKRAQQRAAKFRDAPPVQPASGIARRGAAGGLQSRDGSGRSLVRRALGRFLGIYPVELPILLAVFGAIAVTMGCVAFAQLGQREHRVSETRLYRVAQALQDYQTSQFPPVLPNSLQELAAPPSGEPAYIADGDVKDAWGQTILYDRQGRWGYTLCSPGPDGQRGTDDDLVWKR